MLAIPCHHTMCFWGDKGVFQTVLLVFQNFWRDVWTWIYRDMQRKKFTLVKRGQTTLSMCDNMWSEDPHWCEGKSYFDLDICMSLPYIAGWLQRWFYFQKLNLQFLNVLLNILNILISKMDKKKYFQLR